MSKELSAYLLTPMADGREVDEAAFRGLLQRVREAGIDSVTVLGSTGSYAYLSMAQRQRVVHLAAEQLPGVRLQVGISAMSLREVLEHAQVAVEAGATSVLVAPMSYQPLREDEVIELYRSVAGFCGLPVTVYDNPRTTHFQFTDALYAEVASLPGIAGIKIPPVPGPQTEVTARITSIRGAVGDETTLGISGDPHAATGLVGGCQLWHSVLAGTEPVAALRLLQAVISGNQDLSHDVSARLEPVWELYAQAGSSVRAVAAIAHHRRLASQYNLPLPLRPAGSNLRPVVERAVAALDEISAES